MDEAKERITIFHRVKQDTTTKKPACTGEISHDLLRKPKEVAVAKEVAMEVAKEVAMEVAGQTRKRRRIKPRSVHSCRM